MWKRFGLENSFGFDTKLEVFLCSVLRETNEFRIREAKAWGIFYETREFTVIEGVGNSKKIIT